MKHDCIIGLLHHWEYSELITLDGLKQHIKDKREHNEMLKADPIFRDATELYAKVWTLKCYGDKRKNTNLTRFDFCPYCGQEINWRKMRLEKEEL